MRLLTHVKMIPGTVNSGAKVAKAAVEVKKAGGYLIIVHLAGAIYCLKTNLSNKDKLRELRVKLDDETTEANYLSRWESI